MKFTAGPASFYETAVFDPTSLLIGGATNVIGGLLGANAASNAADTQAGAANRASDNTMAMYNTTREDLAPYRGYGTTAGNKLVGSLDNLTAPFNPTQAQLEATPGYQFNRAQGLNAVQNSAAAKGLGISGAALKGAADYATGLADSTLQTQFNIDQANKTNSFNKLMALTGAGQSAAAQTGNFGMTAAQNAGQFSTSGANALAAGQVGGVNAITNGLNNGVNSYLTGQFLAPSMAAQNAQADYYKSITKPGY